MQGVRMKFQFTTVYGLNSVAALDRNTTIEHRHVYFLKQL